MKKKYIAIIVILLIVIGILIFKIISDSENTPGKLIEDDINKFQKNQEDELKSVKEEDFLGWWNGILSAKVEKNRIIYYNATDFERVNDDNSIIDGLITYTNKDKTGLFGTFTNDEIKDFYIKIGKKEDSFFIEINDGGYIENSKYEKIGYIDYESGKRVYYFLSQYKESLENIKFKDGKIYKGNEVVMEKVNGVVKIENRECQRMNILDE